MSHAALHALVVDDNYFNRNLCVLALDHVGYTAVEAEDGLKALEILERERFDLLLLDLAMPHLDGRSVIEQLQARKGLDKLTLVVITAHSHLAADIYDIADFVMFKPIDIQLFTRFLQRMELRNPRV